MPTSSREKLFWQLDNRADAVAFELGEERVTFGELDDRARRYASWLGSLGLEPGARVASWLGTSVDMIVALLGHYYAGLVHVPVNTRYGEVEVRHILEDSMASVVLVDTGSRLEIVRGVVSEQTPIVGVGGVSGEGVELFTSLIDHAAPRARVARDDEDAALFIYTSGTTGRSKGVVLSYRAVVSGIDALTTLWRWTDEDVLVLALPLFHVHGLGIGVHGTLLRGCRSILHERFDAARVIEEFEHGASIFMGVPTMYTRLVRTLEASPELGAVLARGRLFTSGSAALSADLFERFESITGHRILERYGMSETLLTISNPYEPSRRKPGTIGFAVPGCQVRIVDEEFQDCEPGVVGQILISGASVMTEYWRAPEKTASTFHEEWLITGDAACFDEDGYVVHKGRRSVDILKCGGYKISAREIEEVIQVHADVDEVAVIGIPDEEWGQRIIAAVVPHDGVERGAEDWADVLTRFLKDKLADFKKPRGVIVLDELPRNALGKVQKHLISATPR